MFCLKILQLQLNCYIYSKNRAELVLPGRIEFHNGVQNYHQNFKILSK